MPWRPSSHTLPTPMLPLTPEGRLKLVQLVIRDGWTQARAAERFQIS